MITCHLRYEIHAAKVEAFERFAQAWMGLVERHGGTHHGYFLPSEGASDIAYALFSFPSLADYERYRGNASASIRSSSPPTASARSPVACVGTSAASCARCCRPAECDRQASSAASS